MGWARANILYDKLGRVPEPGSLQEAVMMLVFRAREEYSTLHVMASLTGSMEQRTELFDEYKRARFPFVEAEKVRKEEVIQNILKNAFEGGPMVIERGES